jgi:transcriptional regulator with XRE-family HTH domain
MPERKKEGLTPLGDRIKQERNRMGYDVRKFAVECGIPVSAVTGYENRGVKPSIDTLVAMCQVLNCPSDYLLGLDQS